MERKHNTDETTVCPRCEGYGYLNSDTIPVGSCNACEGSGWLTKSQLEEWEIENSPFEWMDEGW